MSKKLEAVQDRVGKKLLGASRSVADVASCVRRPIGWKELEERREEKNILYGRRVERLDDGRLVEVIARKREECGRISWWGEYDQLLSSMGWMIMRGGI